MKGKCLLCLTRGADGIDLTGEFSARQNVVEVMKKYFWHLVISVDQLLHLLHRFITYYYYLSCYRLRRPIMRYHYYAMVVGVKSNRFMNFI